MHRAAATARNTSRLAKELGDHFSGWHALCERMAMPAVGAENDILMAEMRANTDRNRFLADVGVAGAGDIPLLVGTGELLLCFTDIQHLAVQPEHLIPVKRGRCVDGGRHRYTIPHSNCERISGPDSVTSTIFSARAPKLPSGP